MPNLPHAVLPRQLMRSCLHLVAVCKAGGWPRRNSEQADSQEQSVDDLLTQLLSYGPKINAHERGAILALLGSVERAQLLTDRIDAERKSVSRSGIVARATAAVQAQNGRSPGTHRTPTASKHSPSFGMRTNSD
jgi:hypothetical protein